MNRLLAACRKILTAGNDSGTAAVEFGILLSVMALALPVLIDMSTVIRANLNLSGAQRAGIQAALKYPDDSSRITDAISQASGLTGVTVNTNQFCECNGTTASCTATCAGTRAYYITLTSNYTPSLLYNYAGMLGTTLTRTITVRYK